MTAPAQTLELIEVKLEPLANPTHSLILADAAFLSSLREVSKNVEAQKTSGVTNVSQSQLASELQQKITAGSKKLDAERLALKRPFMDMCAKIDEVARGPLAKLDALKKTLSDLNTAYIQAEQQKARQAEQQRQKELRELELKRQQEERDRLAREAEALRKANEAAEAAAAQGVRVVEMDEEDLPEVDIAAPTEVEQQIAVLQAAPVATVAKPSGVRITVTLVPFVEDVNKLADIFFDRVAKMSAIRAAFCQGYRDGQPIPVCPGVRFEVQRSTQSTGKSVF
jgi:hypothetical protein